MRLVCSIIILLAALQPALLAQDVPGARVASGKWGVLWVCSPSFKVRPDIAPPSKTLKAVEIAAARNEFEAFQLVLRPTEALANVKVTVRSFVGPKGARVPAWAITVHNVEFISVTDETGRVLSYPDPLPDHTPFAAPKQQNSIVWVTVYVPLGTIPGTYSSTIDVEARGLPKIVVPVRLFVWAFDLPSVSKLRTSFGCDMARVCEFQGAHTLEQRRKLVDIYNRVFWRHRVSPSNPFFTYDIKVAELERGAELDFAEFDKAIKNYLPLFNSYSLPDFVTALKSGERDPEQDNAKIEYMRTVAEHLADKGQIGKGFNWICDDPQPEHYPALIDAARLCRGADGRIKVLVNSQIDTQLIQWVDIWAPRPSVFDEEKSRLRQASGEEVWWYLDCKVQRPYPNFFIDYPAIDQRIIPWLAWRFKVNGILYQETARWEPSPWDGAVHCESDEAAPRGYGGHVLVYPPIKKPAANFVAKGPVYSIRWELIRDGMEDYDYFALLSELSNKLRKSNPRHPTLAQADEALTAVNSFAASLTDYTKDSALLETTRRKVARAIESVKRAVAAMAKR